MNAAGDGTPGKYLEVFMEAYSDFARVYDIFMDNVEYEKWAEYLIGSLKEYGIEDGIVLEPVSYTHLTLPTILRV